MVGNRTRLPELLARGPECAASYSLSLRLSSSSGRSAISALSISPQLRPLLRVRRRPSTPRLSRMGLSSPRSGTVRPATQRPAARRSPVACRCPRLWDHLFEQHQSRPLTHRHRPVEPSRVRACHAAGYRSCRANHLYPAFPFDHFHHVTEDDDKALYAYLMTRDPVNATPPAQPVGFPVQHPQHHGRLGPSLPQAGSARRRPQPERRLEPRSLPLVEGLGHCASCHHAAEQPRRRGSRPVLQWRAGDRWLYVYSINDKSPAPQKWDVDLARGLPQDGLFRPNTARRVVRWRR